MTEEEYRIADCARRIAWQDAEIWLRDKAEKSRKFPGADHDMSMARAAAYENAAETMKRWRGEFDLNGPKT